MAIWNKIYETMDREELKQLQLERLQAILNRVYKNVPSYRHLFDEAGVGPEDITSLEDIIRIPFTSKSILFDNYPYGMFALPLRDVVRIQTTSGTKGEPVIVGYTENDVQHWTEMVARVLVAAGVTKDDIVQIAFEYGLFTGGLGFHYGAEKVGASVIPSSSVSAEKQIMIMRNCRTTVLICTPFYGLHIAETLEDMDIKREDLALRLGLFGAEPWGEEVRKEIEERLKIRATDNYGLTEIIGPGIAGECEERNGLHIAEDHFLPEMIDPNSGELLPYGETGELVLTTLTKEAFPLIRYRTGDIASLNRDICPCGRTTIRMSRVTGRTDDMFIINGVNVFPSEIESVLSEIEETTPHYQVVVDRKGALDELEIWIEVAQLNFFDEIKKLQELERKIIERMQNVLSIAPKVKLVEPRTMERARGKVKRVIDLRGKGINQ